MTNAYLVTGVRTPIGRYGGALAAVRPDDLAAHVIRALADRLPSVDWSALDDVLLGCANQAGRTTATWHGWRPCSPACRSRLPAAPSTGSAAPGWTRSGWRPARSAPATPT